MKIILTLFYLYLNLSNCFLSESMQNDMIVAPNGVNGNPMIPIAAGIGGEGYFYLF